MRQQILCFVFILCFVQSLKAQFNYPTTKTVDSSDTWHNVTVKDPYRWLEDLKNPAVADWFKSQANFTDSILNKLPYANTLFNELTNLDIVQPEQKFSIRRVGKSIFYNQVKSGEGKFKVYRQLDNSNLPQVIATPEMWGENYNIYAYDIDPSEKFIAIYALEGGKEINEVKIYSIAENKILPDKIEGSYKGFMNNQDGVLYYIQRPTYNPRESYSHNDEIFKTHIIGTDTSLDKIIVSKQTNPEVMSYTDERYLWEIKTFKGCNYEFAPISPSEIYYRKSGTDNKWLNLFDREVEDVSDYIYFYNNKIIYTSFKDAPNGKLKMLDLNNLSTAPKTILAEQSDPIDNEAIGQTKNYLIVPFKKNGITTYSKFIYLPTYKITTSPFKEYTARTRYIGTKKSKNDSVFIVREDWANPVQLSYGDIASKIEIPSKYYTYTPLPFASNLMVEEIEVASYDGTLVPLTIIRRKDLKMNGNNIALLNGYGAYGTTWAPEFNRTFALLANKGMVVCIAHVRGGGEKGDNWHKAGTMQSKPNTWKDFNACAEYLIAKGYTSKTHLACEGGSAGGILIGRAITERPDLWACAIPEASVLNILRFEYSAGGKTQAADFGTLDNINEYFSMMESDALLHIQKGVSYPAMLVITGWDDQRVNCWQGGKFAAASQHATTSGKPVLLKVNFNGGHGGDMTSKEAAIKEQAARYAFVLWQCGFDQTNKYN
ncbi:MAG: prolyl oligopeptidase family serine peptidase [Chitinophagaceae bacterium]|nr:prolyl oligopeptidase family serine peptidase [Chitinophagaceae bacterium]